MIRKTNKEKQQKKRRLGKTGDPLIKHFVTIAKCPLKFDWNSQIPCSSCGVLS